MTKQEILRMVESLPDESSVDLSGIASEVERALINAKIRQGIEQIENGQGIPHAEIEAMVDGWLQE